MEVLPIGTVVTLKNGKQELMITARFPLYNHEGEIGYLDYAGCLYPQGQFKEENYFFNTEDIETIHFEGYVTDKELELQQLIIQQLENTKYPKLSVKETRTIG